MTSNLIPLYEDFDNSTGQFQNYETYDSGQQTQLAGQKHVDIRSFQQNAVLAPYTMFNLDSLLIQAIDGQSMSQLEGNDVILLGENWTSGTVGPQTDRNNFSGISLSCTTGTNTTSSILNPVDISQMAPTDYISLALPGFPAATLTPASTYLDITSNPSGNFTTGPTDSIPFSDSTTAVSFPVTPIVDSFTTTGALTTESRWLGLSGMDSLDSNGSVAYSPDPQFTFAGNILAQPSVLPIEAYVTLSTPPSSEGIIQLVWLDSSSTPSGYVVSFTSTYWSLERYDNDVPTGLTLGGAILHSGDTIGMTIGLNGLITVWHQTSGVWASTGSYTDTTYLTTPRHVGLATYDTAVRLANFGGGTADVEVRFPISLLSTVARSAITAVRFRVQATAACTFRCLAIRALAASWEFAPIDQNTLYDRIGATVPPSGSLGQSYSFPTAAAPVTPADWPILLFSDGASGPGIVDIETGAVIETGAGTALSTFTLYLRELPMITSSMQDLDGTSIATIEATGQQPDYTPGTLNDFSETRFLTVSLQWGTNNSMSIGNETGPAYTFGDLGMINQSSYYLHVVLAGNSLRAQIYPISDLGLINWSAVVFDSTAIIDSSFVQRRRGRCGWYAHLAEGDTYVTFLRPSRIVYGEYRSAPLNSFTPVDGARLYTSSTPDVQLYDGATGTPGAVIAPDVSKSRSGNCISVYCNGNSPLQGLISAPIRFENFYDTEIEFDLLAPASANLIALLYGENRFFLLYLPPFTANRWTHMKVPLQSLGGNSMPGVYSLYVVQSETGSNTWYIDNPQVHSKAVAWYGRGQAADPWGMNDPAWINFGDAINDPYNAAMLGRGTSLQVRGQVLTQDGAINNLKILPKYAELGNFIWSDEEPSYGSAPAPSFTTSPVGTHEISCNATASTASEGIASYHWTFGDGSFGYGEIVTHTYTAPGSYVVTLVVIDTLGQKVATTQTVNVT